jgi:glucose uptake protein GlcU
LYRKRDFDGAGYLISYACGSMLILVLIWVIRYIYNVFKMEGDFVKAYNALPSFHFQQTFIPGLKVGMLFSVGNFCSIIAISSLGQGVGGSFIQSSMLVSGLWGIALGEIKGRGRIVKWIVSSIITIIGAICLSQDAQR